MYLKNDLVTFTPLSFTPHKKMNIISTCFFKRHQNKNYKKDGFNRYIDGLSVLNDKTKRLKGFRVRMFIDKHIHEDDAIMKKLSKLSMIDLVLFECPAFMKDDYHIGLFGTLVRFFPMFDFPGNDANIVILSDIDDIVAIDKYKPMIQSLQDRVYAHFFMNISRHNKNKQQYDHIYKGNLMSYVRPQELVVFKQLPADVLMHFLIHLDPTKMYTYYIHPGLDKKTTNYSMKYHEPPFVYGCDEYFLNEVYVKALVDGEYPYSQDIKFNLQSIFFYQYNIRNEDPIPKEMKLIEKEMKHILTDAGISTKGKSLFSILDKELYQTESTVLFTMYSYFLKRHNDPKYVMLYNPVIYKWLELQPELFGVYDYNMLCYHFTKYPDEIQRGMIFHPDKIEELRDIWNPV